MAALGQSDGKMDQRGEPSRVGVNLKRRYLGYAHESAKAPSSSAELVSRLTCPENHQRETTDRPPSNPTPSCPLFGLKKRAERIARLGLRPSGLSRLALGMASRRGSSIILLYHRIGPADPNSLGLVPRLPDSLFRRQLEILLEIGTIVSLDQLVSEPATEGRLRFAITFDDDDPGYVEHALPVLQSLGAPATFFLSGRSLHGLGSYWWELLETAVARLGLQEVTSRLNVSARDGRELAAACEGTPLVDVIPELVSGPTASQLDATGIRTLTMAGMDIGFHTLYHPVLPSLAEAELDAALTEGRDELESVVGKRIEFIAYPHGRGDERVALHARKAGYKAAFTNQSFVVTGRSHPYLLGRWDTRHLQPGEFKRSLILRLNRPGIGPTL